MNLRTLAVAALSVGASAALAVAASTPASPMMLVPITADAYSCNFTPTLSSGGGLPTGFGNGELRCDLVVAETLAAVTLTVTHEDDLTFMQSTTNTCEWQAASGSASCAGRTVAFPVSRERDFGGYCLTLAVSYDNQHGERAAAGARAGGGCGAVNVPRVGDSCVPVASAHVVGHAVVLDTAVACGPKVRDVSITSTPENGAGGGAVAYRDPKPWALNVGPSVGLPKESASATYCTVVGFTYVTPATGGVANEVRNICTKF